VTSSTFFQLNTIATESSGKQQQEAMEICNKNDVTLVASDRDDVTIEMNCVVMIGELSVGKSALCRKFFANGSEMTSLCDDVVLDEQAANHHIYERPVKVDDVESRLRILDINTERHLLDCCHDDQFANLKSYISIGDAFIVAYAVTDAGTFETAKEVVEKIASLRPDVPVLLAGNKCDLVRKRRVATDDVVAMSETRGLKFIETSVNLNLNIDRLFEGAIKQIRLHRSKIVAPSSRKGVLTRCWLKMKKIFSKPANRCQDLSVL